MDAYYWVFWDLLAVAVITSYIYRCARHGFLRTIINFIGYAVSAVAAAIISPKLARLAYDAVVRDMLRAIVDRRMAAALEAGGEAAQSFAAAVPGWMQNLLGSSQAPGVLTEFDAAGAAGSLLENALADPVITLLSGLFFFLLFGLFGFFARRIAAAFGGVNRLPLIGTLNTFGGGVLGVFQAALVLFVVAVGLRLLVILSGNDWPMLNSQAIESGYIFRFFWKMSG